MLELCPHLDGLREPEAPKEGEKEEQEKEKHSKQSKVGGKAERLD